MKKKVFAWLLMFAMVLSLTACGANESGTTAAQGSEAASQGGASEDAARDVLNVCTSVEPDNKDPFFTSSGVSYYLFNCVFSTVIEQQEDGSFKPELATEWTVSDDLMTYTFTIREDAKFHDGTPVTAEDVAFSIETDKASPLHAESWAYVESVKAEGNVVTLTMSEPYRYGLHSASHLYVVCKAKYQELGSEGYAALLLGSGPYKLDNYDTATGNYTLTRFEDYFGELPSIKTINNRLISDKSTSLIALEKGEVDWTGIDASQIATVEANDALIAEDVPSNTSYYLYFNTKQAPFDNAKLRSAISYAIDTEAVALASGGSAHAEGLFWSPLWGDEPAVGNKVTYDPDKAAALLAEGGITTPFDAGAIVVMPQDQNVGVQVQSDLAKAGINVTIETADINTWIQKLTTGDYFITIGTIAQPESTVNSLISAFQAGSPANYCYYDGAEEQIAALKAAKTDEEVNAAITGLLEKVNEDMPAFRMSSKGSAFGYNKNLKPYHAGVRNVFLLDWSKFSWQ